MNQPYSHWYAQNSPETLPLAARYQSADPISWNGSLIYPMYTEQVGPASILVTLKLLSAAPPAGLRGHGIGLSVVDGHLGIDGRRLAGVDVWSDALAAGITFEVVATNPGALFSLTPVWVDGFGAQKSWSGNYGILIEQPPTGRIILWCSVGEGPPNFANLVVEVETASSPTVPASSPAAAPQPPPPAQPRQERSTEPTPPTQPQRAVSVTPAQRPLPEPQPTPSDLDVARFPEHLQTAFARPELPTAEQTTPLQPVHTRLTEPSPTFEQPVPVTERAADSDHTELPEPPEPAQPRSPSQQRTNDGERGYRAALYELGVAMFGRGEEEQACGLWTQAAEAGHAGAAYDLGVILFNRGEFGDAERWWRTAAERRESRAMTGLAELLERQGNHDEARVWRARAGEEQTDEHVNR
ncbi:hypothetical protein ACW2Q0_26980 [Nocardia sp. R16R-3T]